MKTIRLIGMLFIVLVTTTFLTSCSDEYDDSLLTDRIDDLENRVSKLEELCSQMNTNIGSLQMLINTLQDRDYITNVAPIRKEEKTIGYTITFAKNNPITIYHGKDGENGENGKDGVDGNDGSTPIIGVKKHTDGIYYWTINNEWLLDDNGNKIKAEGTDGKDGSDGSNGSSGSDGTNGKDGITPKLKIENSYWFVSYDNGSSWTELGKATGEDGENGTNGTNGDSFFQSVDTRSKDYVVFTLNNGTAIQLPTWAAFKELQTLCNEMNTNIASLQIIVESLQEKDYIKSVIPVMENGKKIGYTILFDKNEPITIYHGKDGDTPIIGVKQDIDNIYYWTINDEWLFDENNNKIKVQGEDGKTGITPQIDIKEGFWYVSYDNGITWNKLDKAIGEDGNDGDSFFQYIDTSETDYVIFTLSNGTIIKIPTWNALDESQNKNIPYLTFTADAEQTLIMSKAVATLEYSVNGEEWNTLGTATVTFGGANGDLRLRGKSSIGTCGDNLDYSYISFGNDVKVSCTGDIRTLIDFENYENTKTSDARFCYLFRDCVQLTTAPKLPMTTLAKNCYYLMFYNCTSLVAAPELPAKTLTSECYFSMFNGCSSLITAPELPATTLSYGCYSQMFRRCTSLTTTPELPATTLAFDCYYGMFHSCTSLVNAPEELPATTLAEYCYCGMFSGCSSLTTAPELPATTLANYCYQSMFRDCISLTTAPELPATTLINSCYSYMFYGCSSLTTAPKLPAITLLDSCYSHMFYGCTKLNSVTMLATNLKTPDSISWLGSWLYGVSAIGTFIKNKEIESSYFYKGADGIPNGWTVKNYGED